MKTRMQPIGNAWQKLPRIVRDLSAELGKQIELEMHGAETELDRQVLELVKDPLTHLVRNCADHGIETPAERLAARQAGEGHDPPFGLPSGRPHHHRDRRRRPRPRSGAHPRQGRRAGLRQRGRNGGEIRRRDRQSDLSCRASPPPRKVTSISGRGVGMDVVRANIEQIGGTVDLKSDARRRNDVHHQDSADAGDRLGAHRRSRRRALRHPAALRARAGARRQRRRASHRADQGHAGAAAAQQAAAAHPAQGGAAHRRQAKSDKGFVVVTQVGSQIFGVVVDGVFHTEEIVIKPMSSKLRHITVFSGTTILGDGTVIMIIDPNGIAQALGRVAPLAQAEQIEHRRRRRSRRRRR